MHLLPASPSTTRPHMPLAVVVVLAAAFLSTACGTVPTLPGIKPHRIEIQQGNYVSQEMVAQLKPGMTREQVRFVLGTPLVTDVFHADRWDYPYFRDVPGKPREHRRLSVFFEGGKLARVTGDVVPAVPGAEPVPAKPVAATPQAAGAKPSAAAAEPAEPEPPRGQNWSAASDDPEYGKEAKPDPAASKPASDAPAERGFFGRMIDRIKGN